jgi:hypothetical protein
MESFTCFLALAESNLNFLLAFGQNCDDFIRNFIALNLPVKLFYIILFFFLIIYDLEGLISLFESFKLNANVFEINY